MNPPPPMFPAVGCVTARAKPVAIAASTALPPASRIRAPTSLASVFADTTIPCRARTTLVSGATPVRGAPCPHAASRAAVPTRRRLDHRVEVLARTSLHLLRVVLGKP